MSDLSLHRRTWDLIPWIVNGTAAAEESEAVHTHLHACADCRAELEFQRRVLTAMSVRATPVAARAGWAQLQARLLAEEAADGADPRSARTASDATRAAPSGWQRALVAAVIIEGLGLGAFGIGLWSPAAPYSTLAAPEQASVAATLRVVFAPTASVEQVQALLAANALAVVSGPSEAGVWSLAPAPTAAATPSDAVEARGGGADPALQALRASPWVRFAEPIAAAPASARGSR